MSKEIENYFELKRVCRSAGLWYVGAFMIEFLMQQDKWSNPDTKNDCVEYMYRECGGTDSDINGTRVRVNSVIRIIESRRVEEALELVLAADDRKLGCSEAKENARATLERLRNGEIRY